MKNQLFRDKFILIAILLLFTLMLYADKEENYRPEYIMQRDTYNTELVIITVDSLVSQFESYAEIKEYEGITTDVVTLSTTGTTASAIRSWLATQKTSNSDLTYVLLGGDDSLIPSKDYSWIHATGYPRTAAIDFYYSNVLSTWPIDDDIEDIDPDVDLYVGRIPVRNSAELATYLVKYDDYRIDRLDHTDEMAFISTNCNKEPNSVYFDYLVEEIAGYSGWDIEKHILYTYDLVDTLNGCAKPIIDYFQARNYSFLYGLWHGGNHFCIFDSEYDEDESWITRNFSPHSQYITINETLVEEGGSWYSEVNEDTLGYHYVSPASRYVQLEDILPSVHSNTYIAWISTCLSGDMNLECYSIPCLRDSNDVIIQTHTGANPTGIININVNDVPDTVYNVENCIMEAYFNHSGGPVAIITAAIEDYPQISRQITHNFFNFQNSTYNCHKIGKNLHEGWQAEENLFEINNFKESYIGYMLFGDPSLDMWNRKAEPIVLRRSNITSGIGSNPTFETYSSSGQEINSLICIIDDSSHVQYKDYTPCSYGSSIPDNWEVVANAGNYIQSIELYEDLNSNSSIPYMMDFEDGIDKNWTLSSSEAFGMHHVVEEHSPYAGDKHLLLEGWAFDMYSTNEASLHLDLAGENRVVLDFWWKEFNDENDVLDGVYISDDNGQSFVKIFSLTGTNSWQRTVLDLDYYIDLNSMSYNNNFIIKFQQYDDQDAPDDGLAFDNIQVYSQYSSIPYSCGFENDLDDYWTTESSNIHGRVQVTTYNNPHSGNKHLTMDVDSLGNNAINRAYLFLNLEDMNNVELGFYWKDYEYSCYSVPGVRFGGYRVSGVVDTSIPDTRYR